jgi:hypothetical protein
VSSHPPPIDTEITVADGDLASLPLPEHLGGRTRRKAPASGLRPTVRFAVAFALTLAWVAFSVWISDPWRDELEAAIGPVMGWVIPIFLAYLPALVIGFMIFLAKLVAGIDYLVPLLDIGIIFFWVPGVILFLFGYPLIFGWWSMLLLPVTLVIFGFMQRWHARHVFRTLDIHPQSDKRGFLGYLFAYQVLTSAAALRGYGQHIVGSSRRWK